MSNTNIINELITLKNRMDQVQNEYRSSNITVGSFTYGKPNIFFVHQGSNLRIGKFCCIAENVKIFLGGEHRTNWVTTYPFHAFVSNYKNIAYNPSKGDINIGNDVWIGNGAIILSGVNIGNGVTIGNGALIAKDIPDYAIVVGNPAKILKYRFDSETIDKLLKIAWWDWSIEDIGEALPILISEDVEKIFKFYENRKNKNSMQQ